MDPADSQKNSSLNNEPQAVVVRREPERELVSWTAPARPFKRRTRQFYVTTFAMAGIASIVLFLAEGIMPVILIISLVFLYYILSTVQPENVEYKVTTKGVKIGSKLTEWQYLNRFWFTKRFDNELMTIDTVLLPGRMEFVINPEVKEKLKKEMSAYIPYEEASPTSFDKVTNWFASKLPDAK